MKQLVFLAVCMLLFSSCEQPVLDDNGATDFCNLTVNVFQIERTPFPSFTRTPAMDACTRLNFALYSEDGTRVKQTNQQVGDAGFGTASFQLADGTYQLVVVAHSSNGNPTMTNPSKIQFTNAHGYTDTFLYSQKVTLGEEPQTLSLSLHRIVALCRFIVTDDYPAGVSRMHFQYKGGSGAFNASTGLGSVNSTQTATFDVTSGQKQFDLYTFLHETEGIIHLQAKATDSADNTLYEREFDVALCQNQITTFSGTFFSGSTSPHSIAATIDIDTEWSGENEQTY